MTNTENYFFIFAFQRRDVHVCVCVQNEYFMRREFDEK